MAMVRLPNHTLFIAEPDDPKSLADLQANQVLNVERADQREPPATLAFMGYQRKTPTSLDQKFSAWQLAIIGVVNTGVYNLFEIHVLVIGTSRPEKDVNYQRSKGIYDIARGTAEIELPY